jgi:hypothetical protein
LTLQTKLPEFSPPQAEGSMGQGSRCGQFRCRSLHFLAELLMVLAEILNLLEASFQLSAQFGVFFFQTLQAFQQL